MSDSSSMGTARLMAAVALQNLQAVIDHPRADNSKRARRIIREWGKSPRAKIVVRSDLDCSIRLVGDVIEVDPMTAEGALMTARHEQRMALTLWPRQ